jgi:hypothetical protein
VTNIFQVKTFTRTREGVKEGMTKIQVMSINGEPVCSVLEEFDITAVINFMTWEKSCCLFPKWTFVHPRTMYLTREPDDYVRRRVATYEKRGWKLESNKSAIPESTVPPRVITITRRVGDRKSWIVPLDTTGVELRRENREEGQENRLPETNIGMRFDYQESAGHVLKIRTV